MKYVGCFLLLLPAMIFSAGFGKWQRSRLQIEESLYRFVSFLQREVYISLTPLPRIMQKFDDAVLRDTGFLTAVLEEESLSSGYARVKDRLGLSPAAKEIYEPFFEGFGKDAGTLSREKTALFLRSAEDVLARDRREMKDEERVATVLSFTLSLGLLLLLL